ncbi:F-box LRR-repeat protein [Musa troglodytarum]|uniref:F-box LRR-repeat protein n=1 Tax=Musa troglodytarum TaxID=320322 RepID=A0A9E7FV44_9LILI|nr:F-box LRR-repeat protein [Musa troglodytarum]
MEGRRWEEMEEDCLVNIFRRLSLVDLTVAAPLVCRSWRKASRDPLCWSVLDFRGMDFMPWSDLCKSLVARLSVRRPSFTGLLKLTAARSKGAARELRFPRVFGASLRDLVYASDACPRLKVVVLPNLRSAEEPHIPEIVGKWKELERLEMESKPSSFSELVKQISLNCERFSGLAMSGSIKIEDVSAIVDYLPRIKNLCLRDSYLPKETLLAILSGSRELEKLSVTGCIGFEADEEILHKASGLEAFEYEGSKLADASGYETDEGDPHYVHVV